MGLQFEKSDLPQVVRLVVEKSVAAYATARNTLDLRARLHGLLARREAVVPVEIMRGRDVEVQDLHCVHGNRKIHRFTLELHLNLICAAIKYDHETLDRTLYWNRRV